MASTLLVPDPDPVPYSSGDYLSAADKICFSKSIAVLVVAVCLRLRH